MKTNTTHKLTTSILLLFVFSITFFASCEETAEETTIASLIAETTIPEAIEGKHTVYNNDGTIDYEDYFYENGTLEKKIEYGYHNGDIYSQSESKYNESGKITTKKTINYMSNYFTITTYDDNENRVEISYGTLDNNQVIGNTKVDYDSNNNLTIATLTNADNELIAKCELTYNTNGALIAEKRYMREEIPGDPNHGYYEIEYEATYEPEDPNTKHEHYWVNYSYGCFLRRYDRDLVKTDRGSSEKISYKRIVSATYYYNGSISSTLIREYEENSDYCVHETNYNEDGTIQSERYYDKEGNRKQ